MDTLQQRFETQVKRTPDGIAVTAGARSLTYRELDENANRLANHLIALGVGPECMVAISLPRDIELIVGILAIVKAGAAYVPLDPEHPAGRLAFYISDCGAKILLTVSDFALEVPEGTVVVRLDSDSSAIENQSAAEPATRSSPDNLAYLIYTSGSTGIPKGVMVTIRNVTRLFDSTDRWYGFCDCDVWTLFHSYAFDFSVWEIWGALLYGGRLVVVPYAVSRVPAEVARLICDQGVTVLNQTPSAFRQVARAILEAGREHSLRYIVFGGEALDFSSLRPWVARYGDEQPQLINMYGITETTVHTTYRRLYREDVEQARGSLIGVPLPDLGLHLLDENLQPVAPGDTGEIFVTGAGVARGYLNRPELTAARFLTLSGEFAYRSGDLARMTAAGDLEYLGRMDQQVKIRGFRIELGEIAARLGAHPQIAETAVIADGTGAETRIVAWCVAKGERPAPSALRRFLFTQVPDYMVPSAFVFIAALPLTVNGKLDRNALPPPVEETADFEAPRTDTERLIAGVWCEVLGVREAGRNDSFIALGGDSLSAARAIARIASARNISLSFGGFMRAATLADLATLVDSAQEGSAYMGPVRVPRDRPLPASAAQRSLWFNWRLNPDDLAYNETLSIHMGERIDIPRLEGALRELGRRHESLRTTFVDFDGEPMQMIHAEPAISLVIGSEAEALARIPFHLARGPLWRALLQKSSEEDFRLHITIHHIIWDALSERVFVAELESLYRGAADLQPLTIQCAEAAVWEREQLLNGPPDAQMEYWKTKLGGELPTLELPSSRVRPGSPSPSGAREPLCFDPETARELRSFARHEGATLFQVLLATITVLLHRYTGAEDISIGTVTNGRKGAAMEGLIGYYVGPLVLRTQIDSSLSFRQLLKSVKETTLDAHNHADVPFESLLDMLKPARRPGVQPLFQVGLALGPSIPRPGQWNWDHYEVFSGHSKFDLSFQLEDLPAGIAGHIEYKTDIVDADIAHRMAGHIRGLVDAVLRNPSQQIGQLPLLTDAEWAELREWNGARVTHEASLCAHDIFEAAGKRNPGRTAVIFGERSLTYAELDEQSNRLAHRLQSLGACPGMLIGMCCERSPEAIVAIVGILKSGAAFVPLDPTYPKERLRFMLEDSSVSIVVTQQVTQRNLTDTLANYPGHLVVFETDAAILASQPSTRPASAVTPRDLAYLIYTSGSTGTPKGVLLEHKGLVNLLRTYGSISAMREGTRVLQFARFSFDASVWEIAISLASGGILVMAPQTSLLGGRELATLIRDHRVEWATFPPSVLTVLNPQEVDSLRVIISAGEACAEEIVNRWAPGRVFVNAYGPTEITVCSSAAVCGTGEGKPSIGRPLPNTEQWVLDANGQPLPPGIPGELYIGGAGLARGYHNRPDLTAERFVPNPFSADPDARLYRTGDLVKWRPDGALDYLGRIDSQVKLRGFRIEIGEIESALRRYSDVANLAVVLRDDVPGDKRLVAYVQLRAGLASSAALELDLRAQVAAGLPDYMVPALFVFVESLPVTPSGKVDLKALPEPNRVAATPVGPKASPLSPVNDSVESVVSAIWREVLGLREVPADAPFFDLGGHSLSLARVQSLVGERLKIEVDMVALFRYQTVRKLSSFLESLRPSAAVAQSAPLSEELRPEQPEIHKGDIAIVGHAVRRTDAPFDSEFFGILGQDLEGLDALQGPALECCWSALENAGYDHRRYGERIGIFGPCSAPALSSRLGLRGPAISINTGATSPLAAVHVARLGLLGRDCEIALAIGISGGSGRDGEITVLVLKRLAEAVPDGDSVAAVIRSSAMSHDCVEAALQAYSRAGINPATLGFVAASGDVASAVAQALRRFTQKREFCALSISPAQANPVVQALMALTREAIPQAAGTPSADPGSPFYSPGEEIPWQRGRITRRAAASASGERDHIHLVMEESTPELRSSEDSQGALLCLSARSMASLHLLQRQLAENLSHRDVPLSDVAYTLQTGRAPFEFRSILLCKTIGEVSSAGWISAATQAAPPAMQFAISGNAEISKHLYESEPAYGAEIDRAVSALRAEGGDDSANGFAASWAIGRLLLGLGLVPQSLSARGGGALAAGALAGIFRLRDAASLRASINDPAQFRARLAQIQLRRPGIPLAGVSTEEAVNPKFWQAWCLEEKVIIEVSSQEAVDLDSLQDRPAVLSLLGTAWLAGTAIDWLKLYPKGSVRRAELPTYPFASSVSQQQPTAEVELRTTDAFVEQLAAREEMIFAASPGSRIDDEPGLRQRLESYCASRIHDFFIAEGGIKPQVMTRSKDLAQRIGIDAKAHPFFDFLIAAMVRAGNATNVNARIMLRDAAPGRSRRIAQEILRECPDAKALVEQIDESANQFGSVLRGVTPVANTEGSENWNAAQIWRQEGLMHAFIDEAAKDLGATFGCPVMRSDPPSELGALAAIRAKLPSSSAAVLACRTNLETWEHLALGTGAPLALSKNQWQTAAQEAGFGPFAVFPQSASLRARVSWCLLVVFPTESEKGDPI